MDLSIIVPAYNEEKRIDDFLSSYLSVLSEKENLEWEIVVVINNTEDNTEEIVEKYEQIYPNRIKIVNIPYPIGKGGALIEGFEVGEGDFISYVDADGSLPAKELLKLFNIAVKRRRAVVFGSRWIPNSLVVPKLSKERWLASRVYNLLVNLLFGLKVKDSQCAAKVVHRNLIKNIKKKLFIADMSFDVNLLYCAKIFGYELLEVPVVWFNKEGSTVGNIVKTGFLMFLSLMRLRLIYSPFKFMVPVGEKIFAPLRRRWMGISTSHYYHRLPPQK